MCDKISIRQYLIVKTLIVIFLKLWLNHTENEIDSLYFKLHWLFCQLAFMMKYTKII